MKRVRIAIAILIVIPIVIFITHFYLKNTTESMRQTLGRAQTLVLQGKKEEAADEVAAFEKRWNRDKRVMETFIRHAELDTVNLSAAKLKPLLEDDQTGEFCAECESLRYQLRHVWETERFSLDNLL